ncbi:hypothetical protein LMG22037_04700 [Paraburkholderia phenoliruptrix]|uniref:Phage tail collar domain-containing protein n=1 Tax=Paraburkholderia phenoliruptrix TaxID=252970 RepID=A0A6J5BZF7_9BURK|nr:hypothetical protein [Paraburkholderia phenoliruptrix]CAB3720224.1 hypothetical protein LMG22037_04700 [Paraburkholderia phenoliruptrix]
MSIIGALPNNLANGTTADASQVMADLNFIVNQVNANASPIGTLTAPSGTRMAFHQTAAPAGWTIDTTITNHTCLYTSSGGGIVNTGSGYSSFVSSGWFTDLHTLTVSELPSHTHNVPIITGSGVQSGAIGGGNFTGGNASTDNGTGGNQGHQHNITTKFQYISMCVAQKS